MVQSIPLTRGFTALIDDDDLELVAGHRWQYHRNHASTKVKGRRVFMHRLLIEVPPGLVVDHCNGNGLDNRRSNLRVATVSQNTVHRGKDRGTYTSRYKGVDLTKDHRWRARLMVHGRYELFAYFDTEIEAARAYDAAARIHHGEFAVLNFPI